ncbi:MAG: phosphodiesterase [Eubacteriales bacterium]|nr:phosphodiesterase [Eubacteriales bacterium]
MKLLIASDLHGSARYCRLLLEEYARTGADKLVLLGDLLYHGPRNDLPDEYAPKSVIAMLNGIKREILCVRGNCEAEVDQMVLEFPVLSDSAMIFVDGKTLFCSHGHIFSPEKLPPLQPGDVLLTGHTHVPHRLERDGVLCLNPGSVSLPKQGSGRGYLLYENGVFAWHALPDHA